MKSSYFELQRGPKQNRSSSVHKVPLGDTAPHEKTRSCKSQLPLAPSHTHTRQRRKQILLRRNALFSSLSYSSSLCMRPCLRPPPSANDASEPPPSLAVLLVFEIMAPATRSSSVRCTDFSACAKASRSDGSRFIIRSLSCSAPADWRAKTR